MKKNHLPLKQKILAIFVLLYSFFDSILSKNKIGLVALMILAFCFLTGYKQKNTYKVMFIVSFLLLTVAVVLYILDITSTMSIPIKKLSEWAYLFLFVGAVQLLIFPRNKA